MRDLKFRAFNGREMESCGVVNGKAVDFDGDVLWVWHEQPEAIMQYTGLKDKNGVEIYEGDVLGKCVMNTSVVNVEVIFANGAFLASPLQGEECAEDLWLYIRNEVIGNIHENPELLQS